MLFCYYIIDDCDIGLLEVYNIFLKRMFLLVVNGLVFSEILLLYIIVINEREIFLCDVY